MLNKTRPPYRATEYRLKPMRVVGGKKNVPLRLVKLK